MVAMMFAASSLVVRNAEGEEVWIASMTYNASISALEVRAYRPEGEPPSLVEKIGKGPLRIYEEAWRSGSSVEKMGATQELRATVHFETVTLGFGFECDPGPRDTSGNPLRGCEAIREVVILRGLRIE